MVAKIWWWLHQHQGNPVTVLALRLWLFISGSYIGPQAKFDGMPCFPHGLHGVFISSWAEIGKDCVIFQNVTIGSNTLKDSRQGAPKMGDNCFIGTNAVIVGPVIIGDNVRIGANSTVVKDVPANNLVVSGAQRNIRKDKPMDNRFRRKHKGQWQIFENGDYRAED